MQCCRTQCDTLNQSHPLISASLSQHSTYFGVNGIVHNTKICMYEFRIGFFCFLHLELLPAKRFFENLKHFLFSIQKLSWTISSASIKLFWQPSFYPINDGLDSVHSRIDLAEQNDLNGQTIYIKYVLWSFNFA